jgi:C-terminal processing protease CtpA/Prc
MLSESFQNTPHTLLASEVVAPILDLSSSQASQTQQQQPHVEPSFVSVMVHKSNGDAKLGITLENSNDDDESLSIGRILDNGLLSTSPLQPGYKVFAINNIQCTNWSKKSAGEYLRCAEGNVSIVAQNPYAGSSSCYVQVMAYKSSPRASIGVSFKTHNHGGESLKIGNISPESIFATSVLNSGDDVISINHVPCQHMRPSEAVGIVKGATDAVTILAKPHFTTALVLSHTTSQQNNGINNSNSNNNNDRIRETENERACIVFATFVVAVIVIIVGSTA